jgi:light-regulated signal transduction histidine kinase (bacteriophytochrome)
VTTIVQSLQASLYPVDRPPETSYAAFLYPIPVAANSCQVYQPTYPSYLCHYIACQRDFHNLPFADQIHEYDEQHNNNQQIIISIKDSGKGIDPQIFPRLFTKFATRSETGTGLGLFICKGIIEAHGGKIRAENNSDSIGATFAFSLPIVNK